MRRVPLIILICIVAFVTSYTLDQLFGSIPIAIRFVLQISLLVIIMDEFRRWVIKEAPAYGLHTDDITNAFFFAAPMAAFGAMDMFADIRRALGRGA
jgi:hypothetical protein